MKKRVIILVAVLAVILAASIATVIYMQNASETGNYAYIYQNDKLIKTIDLSQVKESYQITIEAENGGKNVLEVRNGSIGVVEASCPDHLCMQMGFISNSLMPVTCLPNHLVIRVDGKSASTGIDGVTY